MSGLRSATLNVEVTAIRCYETSPKHPDKSLMLGSMSSHIHEKQECSPAAVSFTSRHAPYDVINGNTIT